MIYSNIYSFQHFHTRWSIDVSLYCLNKSISTCKVKSNALLSKFFLFSDFSLILLSRIYCFNACFNLTCCLSKNHFYLVLHLFVLHLLVLVLYPGFFHQVFFLLQLF